MVCSHTGRTTRRAVRSRVCFLFDPLLLRFLDYIFFLPPITTCSSGFWLLWICVMHISMGFSAATNLWIGSKDLAALDLRNACVHGFFLLPTISTRGVESSGCSGFAKSECPCVFSAANGLRSGGFWLLWVRFTRVHAALPLPVASVVSRVLSLAGYLGRFCF